MKKIIKINIKNTQSYLKVLNGLFNLTEKEILVLSVFIDKNIEFKGKIDVFSAEVKKQVADELGMEDFNILNVYIKRLKDKNAIRKTDSYQINPLLLRKPDEKGVEFIWQENKK